MVMTNSDSNHMFSLQLILGLAKVDYDMNICCFFEYRAQYLAESRCSASCLGSGACWSPQGSAHVAMNEKG
jgi:hypothetical protein